ncbi:MAG: YggT family protein [Thermodesulfobacteriota bacterium]
MFVPANFIEAIAEVLSWALYAYMWIIIARAILSWVNPDPYNPIVQFLYKATEPLLYRIRKMLPNMGGIDLSPIVVLVAIMFLRKFLVGSLLELAMRLRLNP